MLDIYPLMGYNIFKDKERDKEKSKTPER